MRVEGTVTLLPLSSNPGLPAGRKGWGGPAGLLFRFLDSQRYCAACIDEDGYAKLLRRVGDGWELLAWSSVEVQIGEPFTIRVEVEDRRITAKIADACLQADDAGYAHGCVGLIGARPAQFGPVTVAAMPGETARSAEAKREAAHRIEGKRARFGKPVLWRQFDTRGFGSGRRIRLGDLTGDGNLDFLLAQVGSYQKRDLSCMTALSWDGDVLWQLGEPKPGTEQESSSDTPVQIHDVDGDGRNEVICAWEGEIQVLDGATGKLKYSGPLPGASPYPEVFKENILHWGPGFSDEGPAIRPSAISFADLEGRGAQRDLLLCDHYHLMVALGPDLKEKWRDVASHGHFPQASDFDGDGRDSVLAGYHHLSPDGELIGRVCLQDHQDAIYVGPMDEEGRGPVRILMAGGEDGLLTLTPEYDIHLRVMGHVQRLSVGRFRDDLPGLCVGTVLFHGNNGIISLFDSALKKVWTRDFPVVGATLQPVNWDGSGVELMFLSGIRPSQGYAGGLIDGHGDLVVPMPDDGGPGYCAFAHDFDRDGLDELMVWDYDRICIYHVDRDAVSPDYRPLRPPLCNMSNFQSYWSRPAWKVR